MTRIDCKTAATCGLKPSAYLGQFVHRDGDRILLAMDEEENDFIRLDADSAEFLAHKLLVMVEEIRKKPRGRTQTAPSCGQEEAVRKDEPTRR
ncbi:MAG: hypothetical protein QUV05_04635 [Phycisphaerae bacterium]|nr:hypothetical protein [Phycisphaerae bacterium]